MVDLSIGKMNDDERKARVASRKVASYSGNAWNMAHDQSASRRALEEFHRERYEQDRKAEVSRVASVLRSSIEKREEEIRKTQESAAKTAQESKQRAIRARESRRSSAARSREEALHTAAEISNQRQKVSIAREAMDKEVNPDEHRREVPVEYIDGHPSYPVQVFDETHRYGVATEAGNHFVYRERGGNFEWMNSEGEFEESPENTYTTNSEMSADTMARLTALKSDLNNRAYLENSTPDQVRDAENIGAIRSEMIDGSIDAEQAQRRAGIAQIETPPQEHHLAASGNLGGPLAGIGADGYVDKMVEQMREYNASPEEIQATIESVPEMVRAQSDYTLHHVQRPGDYIVSKSGVKWTLDSKGILHPDNGSSPVPLMRKGVYSSLALNLVATGKVGYGTTTRIERRAAAAKSRDIRAAVAAQREEFNRDLRLAEQNAGLELVPDTGELKPLEGDEQRRRSMFLSRPPVSEEVKAARAERRSGRYGAVDPAGVIRKWADQYGVSPEEIIRVGLSDSDPNSLEGKAAGLEIGDTISNWSKKEPWTVVSEGGNLYLRNPSTSTRLPVNRLDPSPRVQEILRKGEIKKPLEYTDKDIRLVVRERAGVVHQRMLAREVLQKRPSVESPSTAIRGAEKRHDAARNEAVAASVKATNPVIPVGEPEEEVDRKLQKAAEDSRVAIMVAKEAYAQRAEALAVAAPKGEFPQRASISVGLRGNSVLVDQNNRQFKCHHELVPIESVVLSHDWDGDTLVRTDPSLYPKELQPRDPDERRTLQRRIDAQRFSASEDGRTSGYNFSKFANPTIDALSGPPVVEPGGRAVSGNGRLQRLKKHIEVLSQIPDVSEREAALDNLRLQMEDLAKKNGVPVYPKDGKFYVDVRMMDDPIETIADASKLGMLFNDTEAEAINESARGLVYSRSFTPSTVDAIGRMVEESEGGLEAAMRKNPYWFAQYAAENFDIPASQMSAWFVKDSSGNDVLTRQGESLFRRAMVGYVIEDPDVLNKIDDRVSLRSLERAIGYVARLRVFPDLDITPQITEALRAASLTEYVDPEKSPKRDRFEAVYRPAQMNLADYVEPPPGDPGRAVEAIWRAMHASHSATPRTFSDRMRSWIGEEETQIGMFSPPADENETPVQKFNRIFQRELKESAFSRGLKDWEISDSEWRSVPAMGDAEIIEEQDDRQERKAKTPAEKKPIGPPPTPSSMAEIADARLAFQKAEQGYITSGQLSDFLSQHPSSRDHVSDIMRTVQKIAEYVFDSDPPEGVTRQNALDWVLRSRVAGLEFGDRETSRGDYGDPSREGGIGDKIITLHKAADATTFIHEFAHVVFPMLSQEDLKAIDSIGAKPVWDGKSHSLKGEVYDALSEKLAHGLERFLRDQNPAGFTDNIKGVLSRIKEIFRKVYLAAKGDPLSKFSIGSDAHEFFSRVFGITEYDLADDWAREVREARSREKRTSTPEEAAHPAVVVARSMGAIGVRNWESGDDIVDDNGIPMDPRKPTSTILFPDEVSATNSMLSLAEKGGGIPAQLVQGADGGWGVRINVAKRLPEGKLMQGPIHPGLELEALEKELKMTPEFNLMKRKLLHLQIENLKNRIRAEHGAEDLAQKIDPEAAQSAREEAKYGRSVSNREGDDGVHGVQQGARPSRIPSPPRAGRVPAPPAIGGRSARPIAVAPAMIRDATPVTLEPLLRGRGLPVGTTVGKEFNESEWKASLVRDGLPDSLPAPTYALHPDTASMLVFPGQKQVVQLAMSALEQGDGFAVITPTGSGKAYTGAAIIREFRISKPDAKVLFITKNRKLLNKSARVADGTFGFKMNLDMIDSGIQPGAYGVSYANAIQNDIYKNTHWDLVVADESGEARRWYDESTKQGQRLRDIMSNADKGVYMSATPFHSPMEYGYLDKLNLWPKGQFDTWVTSNFRTMRIGDRKVPVLDPVKQAILREQLIARGQLVSQSISYEGYTAHFGVVPVSDRVKFDLDRIREGFSRMRDQLLRAGKKGLAMRVAAFESVYTKNFLERSRIPQAIELIKKARKQGWQVLVFSEHTADDLFRRVRNVDEEPSAYQKLDDESGGMLSKIIPPYPSVYGELRAQFGDLIGDYSGGDNTDASRDKALTDFLKGEVPMLYTSYAGGGIGVDMHDADFPDLGVQGGNRPRLAVYLGPPYSGVLLEQAMGRPWRFGTKSDVHAVFLATDADPDIKLLQTKVGPRMKSLRAAVLGERDSLADVMATYTDEEKNQERVDNLSYAQGNEVQVDASKFQVRSKKRTVGIQTWDQIEFPSAEEAKNKGMKYGSAVVSGPPTRLYQSGLEGFESPEQRQVNGAIDEAAEKIISNQDVPAEVQNLEPAEKRMVVNLAAADAMEEGDLVLPSHWDKKKSAVGRFMANVKNGAAIKYRGIVLSQEMGILNAARLSGSPEAGRELVTLNRRYQRDWDSYKAGSWNMITEVFGKNQIEPTDAVMREVWDVIEGRKTPSSDKMSMLCNDIRDMMAIAHDDMAEAGVEVKTNEGPVPYSSFGVKDNYMPHRVDYDAVMGQDDAGKPITVRDFLRLDEKAQNKALGRVPELRRYTRGQIVSYLNGRITGAPRQSNVHFAREIEFPFIKKDYKTLLSYFDQVSQAISAAKNFGVHEEKLNAELEKVKNPSARMTIKEAFDTALVPQDWNDASAKIYNFATAFEAATKMTFSVVKLPGHLVHIPTVMRGRVKPLLRAIPRALLTREAKENAAIVGTIVHQTDMAEVLFGESSSSPVRQILRMEMFEHVYRGVRAIAGESARVYMQQDAIHELTTQSGSSLENTRRMLRDVFLLSDKEIDEAVERGSFTQEQINGAQVAFANQAAFSGRGDPLQMPANARMSVPKDAHSWSRAGVAKTLRLSYALQSFYVKSASLLRENLYDEVVIHGNLKPLVYAMAAYPVVGTMINIASTGFKHGLQRGIEKSFNKKHQEDSWDRYFAYLEDTFQHPTAVKILKWYVDAWAASAALEAIRMLTDPLLDLASGKTTKEDEYWMDDAIEHAVGPFISDILHIGKDLSELQRIHASKDSPHVKKQKMVREGWKAATEIVPALRLIPQVREQLKPPPR